MSNHDISLGNSIQALNPTEATRSDGATMRWREGRSSQPLRESTGKGETRHDRASVDYLLRSTNAVRNSHAIGIPSQPLNHRRTGPGAALAPMRIESGSWCSSARGSSSIVTVSFDRSERPVARERPVTRRPRCCRPLGFSRCRVHPPAD